MINKTEARYVEQVIKQGSGENTVHLCAKNKTQYRTLLRLDKFDVITIYRIGNSRGITSVWAYPGYHSRKEIKPHKLPAKNHYPSYE